MGCHQMLPTLCSPVVVFGPLQKGWTRTAKEWELALNDTVLNQGYGKLVAPAAKLECPEHFEGIDQGGYKEMSCQPEPNTRDLFFHKTVKTKAKRWKIKSPKLLPHYNNNSSSSQPHQSQSYTTSSIRARATATCIIKTTATSSIRPRSTTTSSIRARDTTTYITGTFFTKTRPQETRRVVARREERWSLLVEGTQQRITVAQGTARGEINSRIHHIISFQHTKTSAGNKNTKNNEVIPRRTQNSRFAI
ncbi:hypothetical protein Pmani_038980 [Petrolisthes manimaculis]|uniref:Uncharacterized protein n=1 Tax=Petrolisthes manimaculis TaxID=1843537 RepID=A0AAE1NF26_9EUCA|nr:hypothetical protein Pmani_038980 [Petrolisthes manimaculis]